MNVTEKSKVESLDDEVTAEREKLFFEGTSTPSAFGFSALASDPDPAALPVDIAAAGVAADDLESKEDEQLLKDAVKFDELGRGVDVATGAVRTRLFEAPVFVQRYSAVANNAKTTATFTVTDNQHEYFQERSKMAEASGSYGLFSGGASYSSRSTLNTTSYSLHLRGFARNVRPVIHFDTSKIKLTEQAVAFLKQDHSELDLLEQFGDSVIVGVLTGNEVAVDIKIDTKTRAEFKTVKAELNAAMEGFASGSASFSNTVKEVSKSRDVTVSIHEFGKAVKKIPTDKDSLVAVLNDALSPKNNTGLILRYITRKISSFIVDGEVLDWVDQDLLYLRADVDKAHAEHQEYLDQALIDAKHVLANKEDFDEATLQRATSDIEKIAVDRERLTDNYRVFEKRVWSDGVTSDIAKTITQFKETEFQEYLQKVDKPPAPRRRKRRRRFRITIGPLKI